MPETPGGTPRGQNAFRETVLLSFRRPPGAYETARQLGFSMTALALAMERCLGGEAVPSTREELSAAAADLRVLQEFLFRVGREAVDRDLTPAERKLSRLASNLATRVGGIAATIEDALQAAATA